MQAEPYASQQSQADQQQSKRAKYDRTYLCNWLGGILRIIQFVLNILVIIGASIYVPWVVLPLGGGWAEFVAVLGIIVTAIVFFLHLCNCIPRLPAWWPLFEFIFAVVMSGLYLITFIISAARAAQLDASISACAAFSFLAMVAYAVDAYFTGVAWRASKTQRAHSHEQPTAVVVTNTYSVAGQSQMTAQISEPPSQYGGTTQPQSYDANAAWGTNY